MGGAVYSYMRFSDPKQAAGHSAERQLQYAAAWAANRGLSLDSSLSLRDEGLSAYHQQHVKSGALGVFLRAVEDGRVAPGSVLIVEGLDRLSRAEPIQAQAQLAQIINAGITVVTASDGKEYSREKLKASPMDLVYSLLVMIRAHEESDTKSKRVTAAIRRQCEGWLAGTYRGLIRNGKDPVWLARVEDRWEFIPERVAAVRAGLEMYRRGYGASRIVRELEERTLSLTGRGPQALQIYRLIRQRALIGEKEISVDGEEYRLPGYYPPLLTPEEWSDLQTLSEGRGRRQAKGPVPHVITGMGITTCGYCGRAMVGQNVGTRRRQPDGRMWDGHRRLHCTSYSAGGCPVSGSVSVAPVERALMRYCADQFNLAALYGGDSGSGARSRIAQARERIAELEQQLERVMAALLADDGGGVPLAFARKAREIETQIAAERAAAEQAERELAGLARRNTPAIAQQWADLVDGVEAQNPDARLQARQLVADTFNRIAVYHRGLDQVGTAIDLVLVSRSGVSRMLRIDRKTGEWHAAEDLTAIDLPELEAQ